jgi:hypothetical protein
MGAKLLTVLAQLEFATFWQTSLGLTDSTPHKKIIQTTDKVVAIGSNLTSATHRRSKHE